MLRTVFTALATLTSTVALLAAGCTTPAFLSHKPAADLNLAKLDARLSAILDQGQLPALDDLPAAKRAALLDPTYGYAADYRAWIGNVRDYNHKLERFFEYRNLPLLNAVTDAPLAAPATLDCWVKELVGAPAGAEGALREADALLAAFPPPQHTTVTAVPTVAATAPFARFQETVRAAAARVNHQALADVPPEQRDWLQFVVPWICRTNGRFFHKSKGSPDFNMNWIFEPGDPFEVGAAVTTTSKTPIPPELRSVTALNRFLHALAAEPVTDQASCFKEPPCTAKFAARVDFADMRAAFQDLQPLFAARSLDALRAALAGLPPLAESAARPAGVTGTLLFARETPHGWILVGGPDRNTYTDVLALAILDLGGDDDYVWTHPETEIGRRPLQVLIDFAGDDLYRTEGVGGPGAGILGIGILLDRAGNDRYCQGLSPLFEPRKQTRASLVQPDPEGVKTNLVPFPLLYGNPAKPEEPGVKLDAGFAFGAGFLGIGVLIDEAGDDLYLGQKLCFGTGMWRGIGLLQDGAGDDVYATGHAALGAGINGAWGVLDDRAGDDHYQCLGLFESGYSFGQKWDNGYDGAGIGYGSSWRVELRGDKPKRAPTLGGGIGLVHDAAGNDSYIGSSFGVAAGYAGGLGAVVDDAGDDSYFVKRGPGGENTSGWSGNHALGNGCHRGVGFILDRAGNDRYSASGLGGGTAWDMGMGYLLDLAGDDWMTDLHGKNNGGNTGWGAAKAFAVSLHVGGTDRYERTSFGDASAVSDGYPGLGGDFSFFFDVGPETDTYPAAYKNSSTRLGNTAWAKEADGQEYPQGVGLFFDGPGVLP